MREFLLVALGGCLTILGGFIQQWYARRGEERLYRRKKLEELTVLVHGMTQYVQVQVVGTLFNPKTEVKPPATSDVFTLTLLYFPTLRDVVERLLICVEKYYQWAAHAGTFTDPSSPLTVAENERWQERYKGLINEFEDGARKAARSI